MGCSNCFKCSTKEDDDKNNILKEKKHIKVIPEKSMIKYDKNKSLSNKGEIKKIQNFSLSREKEIKDETIFLSEKEEEDNEYFFRRKQKENNEVRNIQKIHNEEIKYNEKISSDNKNGIKNEKDLSLSQKDETKNEKNNSFIPNFRINNEPEISLENPLINFFLGKIRSFITFNENILEQYKYFDIDFTEFNYIFILSGLFDNNFKSLYPNILKNSLILFGKDFKEADKLLNEYEKEIGNKKKFILISPCDELETNIATFHGNKSIYYFIGYCLNFDHEHDFNFLFGFSKYYTIIDSSEELIEQLFKLNTLFSYRKKQNYKVKDKMTETFELNDEDTNFLKDFNNECSKKILYILIFMGIINLKWILMDIILFSFNH